MPRSKLSDQTARHRTKRTNKRIVKGTPRQMAPRWFGQLQRFRKRRKAK